MAHTGIPVVSLRLVEDFRLYAEPEDTSSRYTPKKVLDLVGRYIYDRDREYTCVIAMTASGGIINVSVQAIGSSNATIIDMKEILRNLCLSGAHSFIILHNHPGMGTPKPSIQDIQVTDLAIKISRITGYLLVDSIIVSNNKGNLDFYSMRLHHKLRMARKGERGTIFEENLEFQEIASNSLTPLHEIGTRSTLCKTEEELLAFLNKEEKD